LGWGGRGRGCFRFGVRFLGKKKKAWEKKETGFLKNPQLGVVRIFWCRKTAEWAGIFGGKVALFGTFVMGPGKVLRDENRRRVKRAEGRVLTES